jgi:hypothetical protein
VPELNRRGRQRGRARQRLVVPELHNGRGAGAASEGSTSRWSCSGIVRARRPRLCELGCARGRARWPLVGLSCSGLHSGSGASTRAADQSVRAPELLTEQGDPGTHQPNQRPKRRSRARHQRRVQRVSRGR